MIGGLVSTCPVWDCSCLPVPADSSRHDGGMDDPFWKGSHMRRFDSLFVHVVSFINLWVDWLLRRGQPRGCERHLRRLGDDCEG